MKWALLSGGRLPCERRAPSPPADRLSPPTTGIQKPSSLLTWASLPQHSAWFAETGQLLSEQASPAGIFLFPSLFVVRWAALGPGFTFILSSFSCTYLRLYVLSIFSLASTVAPGMVTALSLLACCPTVWFWVTIVWVGARSLKSFTSQQDTFKINCSIPSTQRWWD